MIDEPVAKAGGLKLTELREDNFVLLVDDLPLKRAFISQFLTKWSRDAGLNIVASAMGEVLALRRPGNCRLVILSVGAESLAEARLLAAHATLAAAHHDRPIVVLGDRPDADNVERALQMGVAGYLPTSLEAEVAVAALNFVIAGGSYFPPDALAQIGHPTDPPPREPRQLPLLTPEGATPRKLRVDRNNGGADACFEPEPAPAKPKGAIAAAQIVPPPCDLTSRQQQVLACLKRAQSNKEIARALSMSEATVKVHVRQVMKKLGALNRTHAAVLAVNIPEPSLTLGLNVAPFMGGKAPLQQVLGH